MITETKRNPSLGARPCIRLFGSELADHSDRAPLRTERVLNDQVNVEPVTNASRPDPLQGDATGKAQSRAAMLQRELVSVGGTDIDEDTVIDPVPVGILDVAEPVDLAGEEALASGLFGRVRRTRDLALH